MEQLERISLDRSWMNSNKLGNKSAWMMCIEAHVQSMALKYVHIKTARNNAQNQDSGALGDLPFMCDGSMEDHEL